MTRPPGPPPAPPPPTAWSFRVAETGTIAHLVNPSGVTLCGALGARWRVVAGMPVCADCSAIAYARSLHHQPTTITEGTRHP